MNEEWKETINRCNRILRATGEGQIFIDACGGAMRYIVKNCGRTKEFKSLERLEQFAENQLYNRKRYSRMESYRRSKYMSRLNYTQA